MAAAGFDLVLNDNLDYSREPVQTWVGEGVGAICFLLTYIFHRIAIITMTAWVGGFAAAGFVLRGFVVLTQDFADIDGRFRLNNWQAVVELFESMLQTAMTHWITWFIMGLCLFGLGLRLHLYNELKGEPQPSSIDTPEQPA
ncbi:hypothetical protein A9Q89_03675 [Gammaproteobacteria bacterium 53_120_T64]|nr:hypothetical protein A9Q89_03675 [Gammaproteobacteria bacterium 53_120_T64]